MPQPPTNADHPRKEMSPWVAWVATITVAVVLLVVIVIAAVADGIRIRAKMWELDVLRTSVPAREVVYPEPIPAPPTVVTAPQEFERVSDLGIPFASLVMDTVLRSGPGAEYAIITDLFAGDRVQVLLSPIEIQGRRWLRVRTAEGRVGWCMVDALTPVSAE
jgi:uncharacterized protein YgiM (DUF1202 family)